jgi:DNA-binding LytR/AlgR family response regulator
LLARARVAPEALVAIQAEDHYCRVRRRDGSSALVHYRFADAMTEVAALDGAQVHRGTWVAAAALRGAVRERRRWRLLLADGSSVPVSTSRVAETRSRGWLKRISSTASAC